ncbi:uncharacterized protein ARMOST_16860 [Armillaria ostoyae]|uniref:Uncharacterized protein n=1 Tax=Armillaria ostoyae TaxID=47428 RepID=A0A284RXD8_ARMOS|nr:uncharacterized protein ARMOST_16860 [Armillaria ostoyae]
MFHAAYHVGVFVSPLVDPLCLRPPRIGVSLQDAGCSPHRGGSGAWGIRYRRILGANLYSSILNIDAVRLLAVFTLIYIGTEGGWIVTFIINEREGEKNAGYVSSGFFGGEQRCYGFGCKKVSYFVALVAEILDSNFLTRSESTVSSLYTLLATALELSVRFVLSIIENGVAISFVGLLLGPMFPILVGHATWILPPWLLT